MKLEVHCLPAEKLLLMTHVSFRRVIAQEPDNGSYASSVSGLPEHLPTRVPA